MDNVHTRTTMIKALIALPGEGQAFEAQRVVSGGLEIVLEPEIGGDAMLTASLITRYSTEAQAVAAERARVRKELLAGYEYIRRAMGPRDNQWTNGVLDALKAAEATLDRICPEEG